MSKTIVYISNVLPLKRQEEFNFLYSIMPLYRKQKIDGYKFVEDKILSLGVGVLLKKACIDLDIKGKDENILIDKFGKPFFIDNNMFFNLSHSKDMVMCAISEEEVGCDIENVRDRKKNISKKVFLDREIESFNTKEIENFYRLWTLKESYLKMIGKGFFESPLSVEFALNNKVQVKGDEKTSFLEMAIENYKYAVAYQTEEIEVKVIDLLETKLL